MPVIRAMNQSEPVASLRNHLTELLVQELMGERLRRGPVVFEIPVDPESIDVIVVWEAWRNIPQTDRDLMIRDAYSRYTKIVEGGIHVIDPSKAHVGPLIPRVMMATGVTGDEAVAHHLLPFSIQPNVTADEIDSDELHITMRECGAIDTPGGPQLRLPNLRMATECQAHLLDVMPEGHWAIVEDRG